MRLFSERIPLYIDSKVRALYSGAGPGVSRDDGAEPLLPGRALRQEIRFPSFVPYSRIPAPNSCVGAYDTRLYPANP